MMLMHPALIGRLKRSDNSSALRMGTATNLECQSEGKPVLSNDPGGSVPGTPVDCWPGVSNHAKSPAYGASVMALCKWSKAMLGGGRPKKTPFHAFLLFRIKTPFI